MRERLHAQRMLALYRSGRQAEALEAYRDARAVLVEEIGVEPGAELRHLHEAILNQDSALDVPARGAARDPPSRGLPWLIAAGAAAALLVAGAFAFAIVQLTSSDGIDGINENAVGLIDPEDERLEAQFGVGRGPGAITTGGGSVWVANTLDETVSRIDGERNQVTIPVDGRPAALAFGAGSLWVANGDGRSVAQIDAGSTRVAQQIDVANAPRAVAVAAGALWVASGVDGVVHRIELARPDSNQRIALGANPTAIAAGAGAIWVVSEEAGTVTPIEPGSGAVGEPIGVGNGPSAIAVGEAQCGSSTGRTGACRGSTRRPRPFRGRCTLVASRRG